MGFFFNHDDKQMIRHGELFFASYNSCFLQSRATIDALKKKQELAENVLRLAEICRKLETEEEKVVPYYTETVTNDELLAAGGIVTSDIT